VFELLAGVTRARRLEAVGTFVAAVQVLPVGADEACRAAELYTGLKARGALIGNGDLLIAGTALVHGLALMTRNREHFERVEGLAFDAVASGP